MPDSSRSFCVYCKDVEINDATFRYLEIIRGGLRDAGLRDLGCTQDRRLLRQCDFVVTINGLPATRAILLHPRATLVHWFQGIEAVERRFLHKGWRGWGRWVLWRLMELLVLRRARAKLFVSQQMRIFLHDKDLPDRPSLVIPCYNVDIGDIAASRPDRYSRIDMVYAGSLYSWQCVQQSLEAYRVVRQARPDATMTIFTREVARAVEICKGMGLPEVRVEEVAPAQLIERLQQFSFGFILREAMDINEVSTPTKFSSYLGAGVIPVMTKATPALAAMAADVHYQITVDDPSCSADIAERMLAIASRAPSPAEVDASFRAIFAKYFDDAVHRRRIAGMIKGL